MVARDRTDCRECHTTDRLSRQGMNLEGRWHIDKGKENGRILGMVKVYEGIRRSSVCEVTVDGKPLNLRHDLRNHSPTGAEWGYGGSGPAQLALAILADALGDDELALTLYQQFKFKIIAGFEHDSWILTIAEVRCWVKRVLESTEGDEQHQKG